MWLWPRGDAYLVTTWSTWTYPYPHFPNLGVQMPGKHESAKFIILIFLKKIIHVEKPQKYHQKNKNKNVLSLNIYNVLYIHFADRKL